MPSAPESSVHRKKRNRRNRRESASDPKRSTVARPRRNVKKKKAMPLAAPWLMMREKLD
jgi:hypothetical protein